MTCYTLKMSAFISCLMNEVEKPDNWDDIYSEYIGLRENKSSLFILSLMKDIAYLKTKHFIINKCCEVLAIAYSKELVDELKKYGFRAEYNWDNKSTYSRDLKSALSGAKKLITLWQRKEQELEQYQKKHAGKEVQKKDFFIWAITLGKFLGFRIDLEMVTVAEWCEMLNQYERYCEVENSKQNNLLKNGGRPDR